MSVSTQLLTLLRAQNHAGFGSYFALQQHIDALRDKHALASGARSIGDFLLLFVNAVPFLYWQLLFLAVWVMLLFCGMSWWRQRRSWLFSSSIVFLLLTGVGVGVRYQQRSCVRAVVTQATSLRSGPAESFVVVSAAPEGMCGEISAEYETRPSVCFVKFSSRGKRGWIEKSAVGIV